MNLKEIPPLSILSLKATVAFANTAGGIILIGVEDDGQIIGLSNPAREQEKIANSIANRIKPLLLPDFMIEKVGDKLILAIQIDYIPAPYYLIDKGQENGVYVRLGNTNRVVDHDTVLEPTFRSSFIFVYTSLKVILRCSFICI